MHIQTHILSGWCFGNLLPLTARERLFGMVVASIADVDGLGIVLWPINHQLAQNLYWDYHHRIGHGLFFGLLIATVLAALSKERAKAFVVYLCLFHLHLVLDLFGSGEGWPIYYFWPISNTGYHIATVWPLYSWQNMTAFAIFLVWTVFIAIRKRRTPLEAVMPSLDRQLVGERITNISATHVGDR